MGADRTVGGHAVDGPPVVVYIAGSGRSGSTLLERALGTVPGFVNVGELIDLFRRVVLDNERCGCGDAFFECPFWTKVGDVAFGGWDGQLAVDLRETQRRVARQRYLPALLAPARSKAFDRAAQDYRKLYARLYHAVLEVAAAEYVVDASKWPAQALALAGPEIDLRVIHLVRDVRGVAFSMVKRDIARPHSGEGGDLMASSSAAAAAAKWTLAQTEIDLMRLKGVTSTRLRYRDFVEDPRAAITTTLAALGIDASMAQPDGLGRHQLHLPTSHGLSGNPSRFSTGVISLRVDEAWRTQMPRHRRAAVTAISLPQLFATGHLTLSTSSRLARKARTMTPPYAAEPAMTLGSDVVAPLVSVVLPTRGRPELVRASIAAVVAQDYPGPVECLVIHDQEEPDASLVELGSSDHHVTVLSNTHSAGLAGARNTGLDAARGEFIATCDDDDLWHPSKLSKQVALMNAEPDLLVVGSGIRLLFPENRIVDWPGRSARISQQTLLRNRVKELHSSTLLMRHDAFAKAGRYDENLPHGYAEDYDWVLRAVRVGAIGVVIEPLADIRKDVQSWFRERAENTAEALTYLLIAHPEITTSRRGHARVLGQIAYAQACLGQRGKALRSVAKSLARYPLAPHAYLGLVQATTGLDPRLTLKAARVFRRGLS